MAVAVVRPCAVGPAVGRRDEARAYAARAYAARPGCGEAGTRRQVSSARSIVCWQNPARSIACAQELACSVRSVTTDIRVCPTVWLRSRRHKEAGVLC